MSVVFNYQGFVFELLDGELRRYRNNPGEADHEEYLCIAKYKSNRILTQHIRTDGEIVDYVETLFSNLPEFAFEYLMEILNKYTNVIVRATYVAMEDSLTTFEIYYNCDCESDQIDSVINWMLQHNDFAAETYRYTEVLNGHQECVGTYSDEDILTAYMNCPPVRYVDYHSIGMFVNAVIDYWTNNIPKNIASRILDFKDVYALYNSDLWIIVCEQFIYPQKGLIQNMIKNATNVIEINQLQNDQFMIDAMCDNAKSFACQILKTTRERLREKRILELKALIAQKERELAPTTYDSSEILYIYKGNIRCHSDKHNIVQVTAVLHNKTDDEIELNVEYCVDCKKYLLEYTVFEQYKNRYGALIGNFRMAVNGEFNGDYELAEESPLMLSGYNVNQQDNYGSKERHYILARIIHDKIMSKGEVIRYLSYFIRKNGAKTGNELALKKWEEDLSFVQEYDINVQPRSIISDVKKY